MENRIRVLIAEAEAGSASASADLFVALYTELHRLAHLQLHQRRPQLSLGTTTLLHETYLDLVGREGLEFPDRARFISYAARAMRGLIIDYARHARAQKRGGGVFEITLTEGNVAGPAATDTSRELERLSDALDDLSELEPELARLVDLHFFCGYTFAEIAGMRGVSERTVQRDWRKARLLLHHTLASSE